MLHPPLATNLLQASSLSAPGRYAAKPAVDKNFLRKENFRVFFEGDSFELKRQLLEKSIFFFFFRRTCPRAVIWASNDSEMISLSGSADIVLSKGHRGDTGPTNCRRKEIQ